MTEEVDKYVNLMIISMKEAKVDPLAMVAIDKIFRPYLQWIHSAQVDGENPILARNCAVHLANTMILEMATRMNPDEGDYRMALTEWVREFVGDMADGLMNDIQILAEKNKIQ